MHFLIPRSLNVEVFDPTVPLRRRWQISVSMLVALRQPMPVLAARSFLLTVHDDSAVGPHVNKPKTVNAFELLLPGPTAFAKSILGCMRQMILFGDSRE